MSQLRVWFPNFLLESHRERSQSESLVAMLANEGIDCVEGENGEAGECDILFCGSFMCYEKISLERSRFPGIPIVHYCWDLYPFQINDYERDRRTGQLTGRLTTNGTRWREYIGELKTASQILVPSAPVVPRVLQYVGRGAVVVKSSVHLWEAEVSDQGWVVDVMREYPTDPNNGIVGRACAELGIQCITTKHELPWEEFKRVIAGARLLVSAYHEASTGGLSLLEGYALGKPVLLSDSPYQGGRDYFGDRANYFHWGSYDDLKSELLCLYENPPRVNAVEARDWVEKNYGEHAFARRLAREFQIIAQRR